MVVADGETEKFAPLADEPIGAPPLATVYHVMLFPAEVAFRFELFPATIELGVAVTGVGAATVEELITTSSDKSGQAPFANVQRKVLFPIPKPVTAEVGDDGVVIVPDPPTTVHAPTPVVGVFPAKVAEFAQML